MDIVTLGAALNGSKKYTDTVAQSLMGGVRYRGEVDYYADLPSNPEEGDAYTVRYSGTSGTDLDGTEYTWGLNHQTQQYTWIDFSKDSYTKTETNNLLAGKQGVIDSTHKLSADLVDDSTSTNKFVTAAEKTSIGTSAEKLTGITETGNDYIEMKSGIREYLSTTIPTGDIPTGSVGMGFDDGVYTYKSGTKVSEGEPTANLFDKAKAIIGKYVSTSGEITVEGAAHSDYISVVAGQNYYIYGVVPRTTYTQAVGYDADKLNPIVLIVSDSYSGTNGIIEIPTGVVYIIINCKEENLGIVQVSRSSTPLPYEPYGKKFPFYANGSNLTDYTIYGNEGGVGDKVTDSESAHYGEYDIPVICGNTTTHIYLASPLGANDSIDYTTSQVAIPTVDGANNLICDTTVQPSKANLIYTGWHSDLDDINSRLAAIEQAIANGKE